MAATAAGPRGVPVSVTVTGLTPKAAGRQHVGHGLADSASQRLSYNFRSFYTSETVEVYDLSKRPLLRAHRPSRALASVEVLAVRDGDEGGGAGGRAALGLQNARRRRRRHAIQNIPGKQAVRKGRTEKGVINLPGAGFKMHVKRRWKALIRRREGVSRCFGDVIGSEYHTL